MDAIETYRAQKKELDAKLKEFGQELFKPFFLRLFEAHPDAQVVRWYQYTPHFNDGDACVFSAGEVETSKTALADMSEEDKDSYPEESEAWERSNAAKEVGAFFNDIEDVLAQAFGDGVRIFVERSGDITVEDYAHD